MNQPLLINKDRRTGNEVALVPELCQLTGLTDAMRADFRLMKDLAQIVHTNADAKIREIKHLMEHFKKNAKCVEKQKLWHLKFVENPAQLSGFKYTPGNLQMGAGSSGTPMSIDIERNARELDRKIQGKMFTQPALKTWGIFHGDRDSQIANQFKSTMKQCLDQCGYPPSEPNMVQVRPGMRVDAWIRTLQQQINEGVQMVVLLLPGSKGRCNLYDDVKRWLITECAVPSQVVLTSTIQRGKNLRSIISKVLIQMNAKVGGTPWAIDNLPFMNEPTMVCGMDVFHSTALGKKSVLALTASMNQTATTYWSTSVIQDEIGQEGSTNLQTSMVSALEAFKRNNGALPSKLIFYRDGVGEGQVQGICVPEIEQIKAALAATGGADTCKLMYINTSKRVNTRIFAGDPSRFQNPMPGTVIDSGVTDKDVYEFYLVAVGARQGMTTPTRFSVLCDQIGESPDKIQLLTYKLCHNYYNVSGAIKEPACIRYAHRLAALVGERSGRNKEPPVVHRDFEQGDPKLYFI